MQGERQYVGRIHFRNTHSAQLQKPQSIRRRFTLPRGQCSTPVTSAASGPRISKTTLSASKEKPNVPARSRTGAPTGGPYRRPAVRAASGMLVMLGGGWSAHACRRGRRGGPLEWWSARVVAAIDAERSCEFNDDVGSSLR